MIVTLHEIQQILSRILFQQNCTGFNKVILAHDKCWDIDGITKYNNFDSPQEFKLRKLSHDLERIWEIQSGDQNIHISDLLSLSALMSYVGTWTVKSFMQELVDHLEGNKIDESKIISVEMLEDVFSRIREKLQSQGITEFELKHDYYWDFSTEEMFNVSDQPKDFGLGQLISDLEMLRKPDYEPIAEDLGYVAEILEYFSKMYTA